MDNHLASESLILGVGSEIHQNNQQKEGALSRDQLSQYLSMKCQLYLPSRLSLALLA